MIVLTELVSAALLAVKTNPYEGVKFHYSAARHRDSEKLHRVPIPNNDVTARIIQETSQTRTTESKLLYEARYTTDTFGRRTSIYSNLETRNQFALFFGDSFTWGYFVNDKQTLPSQVGQLSTSIVPYNYGQNAAGPQTMLAKFRSGMLPSEVSQKNGILIYTYIDAQVQRAIGSMRVTNARGQLLPFYNHNEQGELVHFGNFISGRPLTSRIYNLLGKSSFVKYFGINYPLKLRERDFALVVQMLKESQQHFNTQFGSDRFYVLIYPNHDSEVLRRQLDSAGIKYLNYNELIDPSVKKYWMPDGHPSAAAYPLVAKKLVDDLELN